jgi:Diacylglycerol kinase
MIKKRFSLASRLSSFKYAFDGIFTMIKEEHNSRIHLFAAVLAILLGIFLGLNVIEWSLIIIIISLVFITELVNSAIEKIVDIIDPEMNPRIKIIKDFAAASVLISAFISVIIGGFIFIPKLIELINK